MSVYDLCSLYVTSKTLFKKKKNKHGTHLWFTKFYYQLIIILVYLQWLQYPT